MMIRERSTRPASSSWWITSSAAFGRHAQVVEASYGRRCRRAPARPRGPGRPPPRRRPTAARSRGSAENGAQRSSVMSPLPNSSQAVAGELVELLGVEIVHGRADDADVVQQAGLGQPEQAGEELALGQVAGRAEQDDDVRVGHVLDGSHEWFPRYYVDGSSDRARIRSLGLPLRLGVLARDVRVHGDAAAGAEPVGPVAGGREAPDDHAEVGAAVGREPAERAGVRTPRRRLDLVDDLHGPQLGRAGHRAGREERPQGGDGADVVAQRASHGARRAGGPWRRTRRPSASGTSTVPGSQTIDRSLRSRSTIIRFSARYLGSVASSCRCSSSLSRSSPRGVVPLIGLVSIDAPVVCCGDQRVPLRARAEQPGPSALDVVLEEAGVRRGVELAQPQVRRHRVQPARLLLAGRSG